MSMNDKQAELLTKRFQTTMIGSLFQFEEVFGYLWGFDKDEKHLTESEMRFRLRWEDVRHNILNNGNHQLRSAIKELSSCCNKNCTYNYKLYNKNFHRED